MVGTFGNEELPDVWQGKIGLSDLMLQPLSFTASDSMQELFTARKYTFLHLFEHLGGAKVGTDRQKLHTDSHRRAKYIDRQVQTVID